MGACKKQTRWVTLEELKAAVADKTGLVDDDDVCKHILWRLYDKDVRMKEECNILYFLVNLDSNDVLKPIVR